MFLLLKDEQIYRNVGIQRKAYGMFTGKLIIKAKTDIAPNHLVLPSKVYPINEASRYNFIITCKSAKPIHTCNIQYVLFAAPFW